MLGLPFSAAVDMWSMGCIAGELYLGNVLYCGRSEFDQMRFIWSTQGVPKDMLQASERTPKFFHESPSGVFRLNKIEEYYAYTGIPCGIIRPIFKSDILRPQDSEKDCVNFFNLV